MGTLSIPRDVCSLTHLGRHGNKGSVSAYATSLEAPAYECTQCSRWSNQTRCTEDNVTDRGHLKVRCERRSILRRGELGKPIKGYQVGMHSLQEPLSKGMLQATHWTGGLFASALAALRQWLIHFTSRAATTLRPSTSAQQHFDTRPTMMARQHVERDKRQSKARARC